MSSSIDDDSQDRIVKHRDLILLDIWSQEFPLGIYSLRHNSGSCNLEHIVSKLPWHCLCRSTEVPNSSKRQSKSYDSMQNISGNHRAHVMMKVLLTGHVKQSWKSKQHCHTSFSLMFSGASQVLLQMYV